MRLNEFRRINPAARVLPVTGADERSEKLAHLEMKMREVMSVRGANGRDLLAAFHNLAGMNQHVLHMSVIRLHIFALAVFDLGVQQNHNIAPPGTAFAREQHPAVGDCVDRISKIAVFAADTV